MATTSVDQVTGYGETVAYKAPCRLATTADIALSGLQTIDGSVTVADDRVLVKDQTDARENGIYIASTGLWSRARDMDSNRDLTKGTLVSVTDGPAGVGVWQVSTANPISIGTTSITFTQTLLTAAQMAALYQPVDSDLLAIAALSTTAYGRALLTKTAAEDLRLAGVVPVYCTLAQLVALDTSKDTVAFVTDISREGMVRWNGSDLSTRTVVQSLTSTSINSTTDVITKAAHLLSTGAGIVPSTAVNGLSLNTVYWVRKIDADTFTLHPTVEDAIGNTNKVDLTGTTNFTLKQLRDPLQDIYIIKTGGQLDGSGGAWYRPTGSYNYGIGRSTIHRLNDKLFIGKGATGWMGDHSGTTAGVGAGSWVYDEQGPGSSFAMDYLLVNAQLASVAGPTAGLAPIGVFGAGRNEDAAANGMTMGGAFLCSGHSTSGASVGYGAYIEAIKRPGAQTTMQGIELDITNLNSTPLAFVNPESGYVQGRTIGFLLASGGSNTTVYDADVGLFLSNNGAKFRSGIVIRTNSLTQDAVTNIQHAILLPAKAQQEWYTSDVAGTIGFAIRGDVSVAANALTMLANDNGILIQNASGQIIGRFSAATGASMNYPNLQGTAAGSGPRLEAQGADTNVQLVLRGKGTSGVYLQDGSGNNLLMTSAGAIGFLGTTPVSAKTGWGVPTGSLLRTTYASYAGQTHTASYVQATIQALDDATKAVSQRLAALITDLHQTAGYGLLRT